LKVFNCPSRRATTTLANGWFLNDYAANGGLLVTGSAVPVANSPVFGRGQVVVSGSTAELVVQTVRVTDLKSGASNTIIIGEKNVPADRYDGGVVGDDFPAVWTNTFSNVRYVTVDAAGNSTGAPYADRRGTNYDGGTAFGAAHALAMNAAYGDGSVRRVLYGAPNFGRAMDRSNASPATGLDD